MRSEEAFLSPHSLLLTPHFFPTEAPGWHRKCRGGMLEDAYGSGVHASVNKPKSKTERAARRKTAVPPSESLTEPAPPPPLPEADTTPPIPPSLPSTNGEDDAALARLADDGGPPSSTGETPVPLSGEVPEPPTALSLEQRVRRLEEVVTLIQEHRAPEPRLAAVPDQPHPVDGQPDARPIPPIAPTAIRLDVAKPLPVATAVPASVPSSASSILHSATRSSVLWLLWDTWAETRAIVRMFVDPRYSLPWSARVLPLILLAAILTSRFWVPFSSIPFLGDWLLVKFVDLLLAFLLFKWLGHEARRYRQTSPDLPAKLRL